MAVTLYNTKSKKKEVFVPLNLWEGQHVRLWGHGL